MKLIFLFYEFIWLLVMPFLRLSGRLRDGYDLRSLKRVEFDGVDVWVHAASAGEAYMARRIISTLDGAQPLKILVTTNTAQGRKILEEPLPLKQGQVTVTYIPFDRPSLIRRAVKTADAKLLVLIELEIWPGLMSAFIQNGGEIIIVNGRMTEKSYGRYLKVPWLWKNLAPGKILAISEADRERLAHLFGQPNSHYTPNMKFDSFEKCNSSLRESADQRLLVLASIRQEEEEQVLWILEKFLSEEDNVKVALFPRHMHRLEPWSQRLSEKNIGWILKSQMQGDKDEPPVILWDVFGELTKAYRRADAAFIGGSLAPLGGQNFIEAFMNGVIPVVGPSVYNFLWAGEEVYREGLVRKGQNREEVLQLLLETLREPMELAIVEKKANSYIVAKQGGTIQTCDHILELIQAAEK